MRYSRRKVLKIAGATIGISATAGCLNDENETLKNAEDLIISKEKLKNIFGEINWQSVNGKSKNIENSLSSYEIHILSPSGSNEDNYGVTHTLTVYKSPTEANKEYDRDRRRSENVSSLRLGQKTFATEGSEGRNYPTIYSKYDNVLIETSGAPFTINQLIPVVVKQIKKLNKN